MSSKLFEEMLKNEAYRKLFDELPDDERKIIMDNIRKLVEQFEDAFIKPIENQEGK